MGNNNSVLSTLFTQNSFKKLVAYDSPALLQYVVRRYDIQYDDGTKNRELFSEVYQYLNKNYRNEYFYKNTLLNKLIINAHRIKTTTALTEVPISKSIADIIMINGKAVVYEIKTELDKFDRLESQINDYYKAFDHVCVVTSESQYESVKEYLGDSPVGIYILTKRGAIRKCKEPDMYREKLNCDSIFKLLNKNEYENIITKVYGTLPNTTQVKYYSECKSLLTKLDVVELYDYMIKELKKRNQIDCYDFTNVPYALRFLVYFSKYNSEAYNEFIEYLERDFLEE